MEDNHRQRPGERRPLDRRRQGLSIRLVGHKGADAILPGNTLESFEAAVSEGVHAIEFDVLWLEDGHPKSPAAQRSPLVVAHDWHDAGRRQPLTLEQALDAFTLPPLDLVEINLDVKLPGREPELAEALQERDLVERSMVSTMELSTLERLRRLEPGLRRGWTYPKVTRDWTARRWAVPLVLAGLQVMRRQAPGLARRELPRMGVEAMWVYYPVITPGLVSAAHGAGVELIAWTVDELATMRRLAGIGVDGICSNDPRLFAEL